LNRCAEVKQYILKLTGISWNRCAEIVNIDFNIGKSINMRLEVVIYMLKQPKYIRK